MNSNRLRLITHLELPSRGSSVRVAMGNCELVFEAVRGGYAVLWHAGRDARRHILGLPDSGRLRLELRPPQLPLRLLLRETVTLAPGARIHGYVQVPLVPTLLLQHGDDEALRLLEFAPSSLAAEWDDQVSAQGASLYCCTSSWFVRYPVHGGEARATLALHLRNDSDEVYSPEFLPLQIATNQLVELRSGIGTAPRRLRWDGSSWQVRAKISEVPV